MGTLVLADLKTEIRSALGGRTDTESRLTQVINLCQDRIARIGRWDELYNTVDETMTYTGTPATDKVYALPSNIRDVLSIRIIDPNNSTRARKLRKFTFKRFDKMIPEPERYTTGIPSIYMKYKKNIEFWRVPDQAYRIIIREILWPSPLSDASPTAVSDLEKKDDMIIALAVSYFFNSLGKEERSQYWWRIFQRMLKEAIIEQDDEPDLDIEQPREVRIGAADYWKDPFVRGMS